MGSASLFFRIRTPRALLSDLNRGLVETFLAVRDHPIAVCNKLAKIPPGKRSYYKIRDSSTSPDAVERAARFIFLNRYCFNGLYRTNANGLFNVPYSSSRTGDLPTKQELLTAARKLACAEIQCADFEEILEVTEAGDFVYIDPPYAVGNRRIFRQYDPNSFGLEDLERLARALHRIDRKGVHFLLTYAFCKEALEAFEGWRKRKVFSRRNIAGFANQRRRAAELIIHNFQPLPECGS